MNRLADRAESLNRKSAGVLPESRLVSRFRV